MKQIVFAISILLFCAACKNDPSQKNTQNRSKETSAKIIEQGDILLVCQEVDDPNMQYDAPQFEVFLMLADSKVKIADIYNCETLTPDLYEQHRIPKNAISAVGGWWAGAGDYIYVTEENGKYVVKQGEMHEEKDNLSYDYKTVVKFSKEGEEVF
ncbi:MAG TPA: hypothetical protein ENJ95_10265 [Bacteroidetes bacterium]|nr:hypothetical protein [Bacteroidota bacterium]